MRVLLVIFALLVGAMGQTAPAPTVAVTDENGVAVSAARVFLQIPPLPVLRCETDFAGRCRFPALAAGTYELRVEKEGFYAAVDSGVQIVAGSVIEVTITHQQEVREVVNVMESPPAIDPSQVSARETISGLDVINIVYPGTNDYRNVLGFIPGVVADQSGQPHVAGAETYQSVTLLDGFNVTQPANGQLLVRVSTDAFRSIHVEPSREPAEYGKGSGGVLSLNTGIGDDHFRFSATDFIPSVQNKHGWRFDQFLPRFTFSGPLEKGKAWFYNAFDGEYTNTIFTALPIGEDNDKALRLGNLTKVQANVTTRDILTGSFLVNHLHDQYAYLSPFSPQLSNPKDVENAYATSVKDQHSFESGELLEAGFGYDEYRVKLTPYGSLPYFVNPNISSGSYYFQDETRARRWQGLANLYFQPLQWHGRHDWKAGVDLDLISYDATFSRQPISYLTAEQTSLPAGVTCLNAAAVTPFPCTRYSTFGAAPLHEQVNTEVSGYAQDRWSITNRLLIEAGVRLDWDEIVRHAAVAPRLAGTYVLDNSGNTKISAGIGLVYDATPIYLVARPFAGTRQDCFYDATGSPNANCGGSDATYVSTTFTADTRMLQAPQFLNWSIGLEKKLPAAIYMKAEFMERRGERGFVYDAISPGGSDFVLQNTRVDRYDAFQITLRHNFRENYTVMGAYTRSRARSNQVLDFNVDSPILSAQQPGVYPWDTPNRFLSWGYLPFFKLPVVHQLEVAYSMEARTGFPFNLLTTQQELKGAPAAQRFPEYFSLNLQLEKKFHLMGYYLAVRGGFDNITGRCDPLVVNNVIDPVNHPEATFSACLGRAFTSRIRLLGRK
jgi:hypothetical protein